MSSEKSSSNKVHIVPKEYKRKSSMSVFDFRNMYCEYARFHMDDVNIYIHLVFIPVIVLTLFGILPHFSITNILKIDMREPGMPHFEFGSFDMNHGVKDVYVINAFVIDMVVSGIFYIYSDILIGTLTIVWMLFICGLGR